MVEAMKIIQRCHASSYEDIMEHSIRMQRSGKVDPSGLRCTKIQRNLLEDVSDVRNMETLMHGMQCHSRTNSK